MTQIRTAVKPKLTGFVTGTVDGRPFAVLTSTHEPMLAYALDDLTRPPMAIPEAVDHVVLAMVGPYIVAEHSAPTGRDTIRVWHLSGDRIGPELFSGTEITAAVGRTWPAVFIGRANGMIALTDLETGRDLCDPIQAPSRPTAMTVTGDGDLIAGFGCDLARLRPPV